MDYLNFDLRIGEWNPHTHTGIVEVLRSPSGEGRRSPFSLDVETDNVQRELVEVPGRARTLGRQLSNAIFRQDVLVAWYESYQIARERQSGLRLRLHIESWELARLPWELLYDIRADDFLAFNERVSIVRYIRLHAAPPSLKQSSSLRLLAVAASPTDEAPLDWHNEIALLREAIEALSAQNLVQLQVCEHATREKLHAALLENRPDVVHYIGHAEYDVTEQQGYLILEDKRRRSNYIDATEAARLLRRYGTHLVVLNACETAQGIWAGLAPTLVRCEIPAVVSMQWPIEDRAAIAFAKAFYRTLVAGRTVDECVAEGRVAMDTAAPRTASWAAPVLFLRSSNGQLWTQRPRISQPQTVHPRPKSGQPPLPEAQGPFFKTHGPLRFPEDQELIVERQELRRALRLAQQATVNQYLALLSARQTGKTTLLLHLMALLQDLYACVFIDLSVLRGQDIHACFRYVASRLISELQSIMGGLPVANIGPVESSVEFLEFLYTLAQAVQVPRIVVLIDEVGALSPEVSDIFFNTIRTVFTQGRGVKNALIKYLFVFSGAVDLYGLTFGTNSPLNICEKIYLTDFDLGQVSQIVSRFERLNIPVAPDAAETVYALTAGHPYLTVRLCALMESVPVQKVTAEAVRQAADQLLIEDDNIRHLLHELENMPAARQRLQRILIEGEPTPFSRNNPILAQLEMIGAIKPTQPCTVRNELYAQALRHYFSTLPPKTPTLSQDHPHEDLCRLRHAALEARGCYQGDAAWEAFATALFGTIPALSIYRPSINHVEPSRILFAIDPEAPGGQFWNAFQPAVMVLCRPLIPDAEAVIAEAVTLAQQHNLNLVIVMTNQPIDATPLTGIRQGVCLVMISDHEVAQLLQTRGDFESFLRERVVAARLRRL